MKKLAIIGSGHLGQLIAHHAKSEKLYEVVGFFDDYIRPNEFVNNTKVIGKTQDIIELYKTNLFDEIIIGVGYKHFKFREELFNSLKSHVKFGTIIHSSCFIDPSCKIGQGSFILPGCVLDHNVIIKENVLINVGCTIAHDSEIGSHTFLSPRVAVAGFVIVGERCNIGINTTVIDNIKIENDIQTGGGTVVINDLSNKGLYVGIPSKFIR